MSALTQYLMAQAARRPMATLRFAAAEAWRRGRMRWVNSMEEDLPALGASLEHLAPFLSSQEFPAQHGGATRMAADAICRHQFSFLGSRYEAGEKIDWHTDWVTGFRWPCVPGERVQLCAGVPGSDVKRPWELSRFQHALALGLACAESGEEKYAREFAAQITQWIQENPCPAGIHWAMPMEVGIRLTNLCVVGRLFSRSQYLSREFWQEFFSLLFLHGRHLYLHREWNPVARGNHYLGCLVGLLHAGVLFQHLPEGRLWYREAKAAIAAEMDWQVGNDGVAQEGSSGYHGFVAEMMVVAGLLAARFEHPAEFASSPAKAISTTWGDAFCEKLEKMFDFPAALLQGRREPPILGDFDNGQLLPLCLAGQGHPFEHLLATGRALFGRAEWPATHRCAQAECLVGAPAPERPAALRRMNFPNAGFFFASSPRIQASIRCGPLGVQGWANHAHCDQLQVEFCVDGEPVVVDPGTHLYTGDPQSRNYFRSSRAHNAPVIAGAEQNRFWDRLLFRMVDDTQSELQFWEETAGAVRFAGAHRGYQRLAEHVAVCREVHLHRDLNLLEICDTVSGKGVIPVEWFWQFAPNIAIREKANGEPFRWTAGPVEISAQFETACGGVERSLREGWFAPQYGVRLAAPLLHLRTEAERSIRVRFQFKVA